MANTIKTLSQTEVDAMDTFRDEALQKAQKSSAFSRGWLRNNLIQSPEVVDLSDLGYEDEHLKIIAENLESSPIKTIFMTDNGFTDEGVEVLCSTSHLFVYRKLETLFLDGNQIGDRGCELLAEALRSNNVLKVLSLSNNAFGDDVGALFARSLSQNSRTALEALYGVDLEPYKDILGVDETTPQNYDDSGEPTNMSILAALREKHHLQGRISPRRRPKHSST